MFNSQDSIVSEHDATVCYWREQLKDISPYLDLNTDRPRSDRHDKIELRESEHLSTLTQAETLALNRIAIENQVALSTVLFCAWQVLLYRYTQQTDLLVGYRCERAGELNVLPIRTSVTGELTFVELLTVSEQKISTAHDYSHLDLSVLTQTLREDNADFADRVLSQTVFKFNRLSATEKISLAEKLKAELVLNVTESEQLAYKLQYCSALYNAETIQHLGDNYHRLLKSIIANPNAEIDRLSVISKAEAERVLFTWNQTQIQSETAFQPIHQLFEARAKAKSRAIALICGEQKLTYGELNSQANQLARCLRNKGVGKGSLVGLCVERSLSMVVGVLAILKAGGAYVPLDIDNPAARLAFILEDARIKVLLIQSSLKSKLPTQVAQTICLDDDDELIANYDSANLNLNVNAQDLAHIVYTSGSTGKPKGVMLTHGNLSHYVTSLQLAWNITPDDIYLHRGSIALIVSARQLLMPLAQGATAVIVTKAETKNPLEFFELIKRQNVTIVDHVPSFWRNFWGILEQQTDSYRQSLLDNRVRLVAAGGEQVTPEIYQCWRQIFHADVRLANIYGQTEGTGVVTIYPIPPSIDARFKSLPVGRPIPNMQVYLLDERLQPVPIGVTAEIHISGAGVARGYLNRVELTQEKFVSNPYQEGERLYKTGDLGCYLADGSIQFLGRADRQVNIQGLRIELGEIEAVLSQSELVIEAAVTVRENNLGETLAAYIVPKDSQVTVEQLRDYLKSELPAYMIPSAFLMMDTLPLTTSGKLDRRALAHLAPEESLTNSPVADPIAAEIVGMLQNILGINAITAEDNFIELGGNSLLAARLVTELERQFARKLSIAEILQASTPIALANLLRSTQPKSLPASCVPIKQGNAKFTIFGIHNLGYGLEFYRPLAKYLDPEIGLYGLSSAFSNESETPHFRDVVNSAEYYVRQIHQIQEQGPYHLMGVSFGGLVAYETAQILRSQGEEVQFLGLLDTYFPHQNGVYKPSLKQKLVRHLEKISRDGITHIFNRLRWRVTATKDYLRYSFLKIDWVRNNCFDRTSRDFAQTIYIEQKKEQAEVNRDYTIKPYSGVVHMFRAADDIDPKLEWHKLIEGKLYVHDVPGEHLEILQEPNVRVLAAEIISTLGQNVAAEGENEQQ